MLMAYSGIGNVHKMRIQSNTNIMIIALNVCDCEGLMVGSPFAVAVAGGEVNSLFSYY